MAEIRAKTLRALLSLVRWALCAVGFLALLELFASGSLPLGLP